MKCTAFDNEYVPRLHRELLSQSGDLYFAILNDQHSCFAGMTMHRRFRSRINLEPPDRELWIAEHLPFLPPRLFDDDPGVVNVIAHLELHCGIKARPIGRSLRDADHGQAIKAIEHDLSRLGSVCGSRAIHPARISADVYLEGGTDNLRRMARRNRTSATSGDRRTLPDIPRENIEGLDHS